MDVDVLVPLEIQVPGQGPVTVVNSGNIAVYYKTNPAISANSHDGILAAGGTLKLTETTWFLATAEAAQIDYGSPHEPGEEGEPFGPALLGADGTVGGTGGSPLSGSVGSVSAETALRTLSDAAFTTNLAAFRGTDVRAYDFGPSGVTAPSAGNYPLLAGGKAHVGDGSGTPLSSVYSTLAEAKARYPFVTSLAQTVDFAALQLAVLSLPFVGGHNAISGPPAQGGTVWLGPGTYVVNTTITNVIGGIAALSPTAGSINPAYLRGSGRWATMIAWTGTGDCLRWCNPNQSGRWGGGHLDLTIDGSGATGVSTGLHIGDNDNYEINVAVQNFSIAGSYGVHVDNAYWWTEKIHGTVWVRACDTGVAFDVQNYSGATASMGYLDLTVYCSAQTGTGVAVLNGAYLYRGRLVIKGNFLGIYHASPPPSPTSAVLWLAGQLPAGANHVGAPGYSDIENCELDIQVECASASGSGGASVNPYSIYFESYINNHISGCSGNINFLYQSFTLCNITAWASAEAFVFMGPVYGDVHLSPMNNCRGVALNSTGAALYAQTYASATGGFYVGTGDFATLVLSQNITVSLTPVAVAAGPQRKTIILQQAASGGPYTVTWPKSGGAIVKWAGGVAPTMSPGASAIDVYQLTTLDGVNWYGVAYQAMS